MVGDSTVGKSSIAKKYCYDEFRDSESMTIGVDLLIKNCKFTKSAPHSRVSDLLRGTTGLSVDQTLFDLPINIGSFKEINLFDEPVPSIRSTSSSSGYPNEINLGTILCPFSAKNITSPTKIRQDSFSNSRYQRLSICDDPRNITVQIWDTSGKPQFRSIVSAYYRFPKVIIFVYDQNDRESFLNLKNWVNIVLNERCPEGPNQITTIVVVANKCDLESSVSDEEALRFVSSLNEHWKMIRFAKISAKTGEGISEVFSDIIGHYLTNNITTAESQRDPKIISLKLDNDFKEMGCCPCFC
ncbi:Ras family GTPase [uncultured virus]|nr:Ras family GTPase [uncultured virus]